MFPNSVAVLSAGKPYSLIPRYLWFTSLKNMKEGNFVELARKFHLSSLPRKLPHISCPPARLVNCCRRTYAEKSPRWFSTFVHLCREIRKESGPEPKYWEPWPRTMRQCRIGFADGIVAVLDRNLNLNSKLELKSVLHFCPWDWANIVFCIPSMLPLSVLPKMRFPAYFAYFHSKTFLRPQCSLFLLLFVCTSVVV